MLASILRSCSKSPSSPNESFKSNFVLGTSFTIIRSSVSFQSLTFIYYLIYDPQCMPTLRILYLSHVLKLPVSMFLSINATEMHGARLNDSYIYKFICNMKSTFTRLCFLVLFTQLLRAAITWKSHAQIRTGQVTMISSAQTAVMTPVSYNISFTASLTATTSCGIGIVGYDSLISVYFALNTTVVNFQTNSIRITTLVFGDTVLAALSLNYIAIGKNVNFTQVQFACFLPTIISTGQGQRSETRTGTTVFVGYPLQVNVYLSGFSLFNNDGMTNYLSATVAQAALTSTLNYVFTTSQNNTISALCYTTVIFCEPMTQDFYFNWGQQGYQVVTNTTIPSNTPSAPFTTIRPRYTRSDSMFFGISQFAVSRSIQRILNIDTTSYNNIGNNYLSDYGLFNATLNYFLIAVRGCNISVPEWFNVPTQTCIGACVAPTVATLLGSAQFCQICNYTCLTCDGAMFDNCTNCSNTSYRSLVGTTCPCVTGYIDIGVNQCDPCEYHIPGCSVCLSTSICILCTASFTLTTSAKCQCTSGFLVTGVCTTITGCTNAVQVGASVSCTLCNSTLFFSLTASFNCICMTGFQLSVLQNCVPVCGDSYLASGETCDDGNTRNGDGCSSTCQVEINWSCSNAAMPSRCFITSAITATVKYIQRIVSSNTALIAISLSPQFSQYSSMSLVRQVSSTMPCANLSSVYTNNLLMLTCPYSSTLEGNTYPLNLSLDPTYFNTSTVRVNLLTDGMNAKLTYDQYPQFNYPLEILVTILDAIALLVLLLSSLTERMIGVEMIQTLQSVLFAMVLMVHTCPSTLESLQKLTYSNGYNGLVSRDPIRIYPLPFSVSHASIEKEFLLNYNFMLIVLCAVIAISIILKATLLYQKREVARAHELDSQADPLHKAFPSHERVNFLFKFCFERVFFLVGLSLMFLTMASAASQLSFSTPEYFLLPSSLNSLVCGASVAITITLGAMIIINGIYPSMRLFPIFMNRFYPPYYVVYVSTFIMLMEFVYSQTYIIYLLIALTVTNAVVLGIWRPYPLRIDNFTIVFNQLVIMGALGLFLFQELQPSDSNETIYLVGGVLLIASLFVCVALAIYRMFTFYKYMQANGLSYDDRTLPASEDAYYELKNAKNNPRNLANEELGNQINIFRPISSKVDDDKQVSSQLRGQLDESGRDINKPMELNKSFIPESNNMDDYDTFNAKRGGVKTPGQNSKILKQIDPNASTPRQEVAPYDIYGNVKYGQDFFKGKEEEYDALRVIKERLRKDFYRKVHGVDYQPQEEHRKQLHDQGEDMEGDIQYEDGI